MAVVSAKRLRVIETRVVNYRKRAAHSTVENLALERASHA
jgi:hypothetical protein